jgi:hypothetical protein
MADITDATIIAFTDEVIRPLADTLTGMKPYLDIAATRFEDQIKPLMSGNIDSDLLLDGSGPDGDGRVQQAKTDLIKFFNQVELLRNIFEGVQPPTLTVTGENAFEDIMKPHVKPRFPITL